jgi:hypothetical protein
LDNPREANALHVWLSGLTALACVCTLWPRPILLTAVLLAIAAVMLWARRSMSDVLLFVCCGVLGALAEACAVRCGAYAYTLPIALGIPLWLPVIWGIAALFVKETAVWIGCLARGDRLSS